LLPQIGRASNYLDTTSLEQTMQAMTVIGMDASHYMDKRRLRLWNPATGLDHVVSLPGVTLKEEASSPSIR